MYPDRPPISLGLYPSRPRGAEDPEGSGRSDSSPTAPGTPDSALSTPSVHPPRGRPFLPLTSSCPPPVLPPSPTVDLWTPRTPPPPHRWTPPGPGHHRRRPYTSDFLGCALATVSVSVVSGPVVSGHVRPRLSLRWDGGITTLVGTGLGRLRSACLSLTVSSIPVLPVTRTDLRHGRSPVRPFRRKTCPTPPPTDGGGALRRARV